MGADIGVLATDWAIAAELAETTVAKAIKREEYRRIGTL